MKRWLGSLAAVIAGVFVLVSVGAEAQGGRERRRERRDDRRDAVIEATTNWNRLGERRVNHGGDHDTIMVTGNEGRFTTIQLRVEGSALELFDVNITFGDGTTFSPRTRLVFAQGTNSRQIDLPGGARAIRRVDFRYANLPAGGRAQIELWAR